MNIEELKKLDDLKQEEEKSSQLLKAKIDAKIRQYTNMAFNDFEKYFNEHKFELKKNTQSISASYGNLIATLSYDTSEGFYIGKYFVYSLVTYLPDKAEYIINLNPQSRTTIESIDDVILNFELCPKTTKKQSIPNQKQFNRPIAPLEKTVKFNSVYDLLTSLTAE